VRAVEVLVRSGPYYLAHALLFNREDHEPVLIEVELCPLFLDRAWLRKPRDGAELDANVATFFRRKAYGRLTLDRRFQTEEEYVRKLTDAGFSRVFVEDVLLINRLCNGDRPPAAAGQYPIWVVAGWGNYEGHLTGREFGALSVDDTSGFLSVFRRAVDAGDERERWQITAIERLKGLREKAIALEDACGE